ncbi:MBOAT family protein [Robertkochia marina]|uniref:MBOAT family protein n=1 Tax=Robertkochia marina TaxID=1227945 RepID=A0A4S3M052_9FLAO|nr:MBOAT family O-acyltransferase [Robertkochia marina]THD67754.1 MBOAT family protein [Robertkochia marina]TRZ40919.1 MBOAT family protein [Robertkochia marina]
MLFNSVDFAVFLPLVFLAYWFVTQHNLKAQNILLLLASYLFYGWWDWRFLSLILFSTIIDYTIGLHLHKTNRSQKRKLLLWLSLLINLGFLGFFKYYNFFLDNLIEAFTFFGTPLQARSLSIILPVGISFYTFQTLSYTIDIYRRKMEPTHNFIAFAAFVSFFPQLVAGPIERAQNLLPQFFKPRKFNYTCAVDGLRQILWGLVKKVIVADSCARYANIIFDNSDDLTGSSLVLGAVFFAFQIYGDFSGYSDIAIGTARLFGFNLMKNFAFPYFSRDIAEFWRRWHISLSTWFRDYLYIPLGGSRGNTAMQVRNVFIIFVVSGFWHGANWTFIVWGGINALYFLPILLSGKNRRHLDDVASGKIYASFREISSIGFTFILTLLAWIFFRAENISHAWNYIQGIFSQSLFQVPNFDGFIPSKAVLGIVAIFVIVEWFGRTGVYAIEKLGLKWHPMVRLGFYYLLSLAVLLFSGQKQEFIYFQF